MTVPSPISRQIAQLASLLHFQFIDIISHSTNVAEKVIRWLY
jgi:hypothetical protein